MTLNSLLIAIATCVSCASWAIEVHGHRGARAAFPENSLPAFVSAIEAGADALELDLLMTRDEKIVIFHDFFVTAERCAFLDGEQIQKPTLVSQLTLQEIKQLDCGCHKHPHFPEQKLVKGTQIPTLEELLDFLQKSTHSHAQKVRLNLEMKRDPRHPEWTAKPESFVGALMKIVKEKGFCSRVYYTSFDPELLMQVRKSNLEARIGLIISQESLNEAERRLPGKGEQYLIKLAQKLNIEMIIPNIRLIKGQEVVLAWKKAGFRVIPWTVNDPKQWKELIEMGVDGIISDRPADLIRFLSR